LKIVVLTPDVVGRRMAGPGIRASRFATLLAASYPTTLVGRIRDLDLDQSAFEACDLETPASRTLLESADVVIGQPTRRMLALDRPGQRRIFDLFDPVVLELDELYRERPSPRQRVHRRLEWSRLERALREGDLLIAATPRQRDFYIGVARSAGRLPAGWLDRWIVVPFGVEPMPAEWESEPKSEPPVILWSGGVWEWLDPELAVRAVEELNRGGVRCELHFLGRNRPSASDAPARQERLEAIVAAAPEFVRWHDDWVPYDERWSDLARAKLSIMLHRRTLESEFSIRTRLFDSIAAALPVVTTAGGYAAELVEEHGLGQTVPPGDLEALVTALRDFLKDDELRSRSVDRMRSLRARLGWEVVSEPLMQAVKIWQK
jgi:glycosyltransferase involved in cell wall biosynthesis